MEDEYVFIKNIMGVEDLALGFNVNNEVRDGEIKAITEINSLNIPHKKLDGTITTIGAMLNELEGATP